MRKIYSFAVAAVAMFAAMSCAKEIVQDNQQAGMPDNDALTFVARVDGADDASETKSVLDGLKSYWNGEEKIWILDPRNETNDEGTFFNSSWKKGFTASAEKSQTATFVEDDKTTSFEGETLMAVYPAGPAGGACWEGGESSVTGLWLSNEQTAVAGSYDPAAHIAIAQTSASSDLLEFKNVSSLLKFSVADNMEGEVKFISYKPSEGDAPRIAGNFSVDYNDGNPSVTPESGENKITFDAVALKGEFAVDNDYYMAILPANLAYGFAVQINGYTVKELAGESLQNEKFVNLLERKRNMILNLGTLSLNFGVCGTHTDWNSDTPMSYDEASGLYVAQDVTFAKETNEFKIRPNGLWTTSVGTGGEIVLNAENDAYVGGGNSTIAAGTYDIWFDAGQKIIYAMSDGKTPEEPEPVDEWAIAGTFNGWSTTANPMELVDGYYVAKNVTGLDDPNVSGNMVTGFKFVNNGVWKGAEGQVTAGTWAYVWSNGVNIYVGGEEKSETAYDIYLNPNEGDHGKFVLVVAGTPMPEDKPADEEVVVGYWAVVGTMSGWGDYAKMTLDGDWHVAENVKLTTSDQFKFRADGNWDVERGAEVGSDGVIIVDGEETAVVKSGKNFSVAEGGFYSVYINKAATKAKVVKTADLPVESTPDQPCGWALAGTFNDWKDEPMVTTTKPDLFVVRNIELTDYAQLKVKLKAKDDNDGWATSYGVKSVNYINPNVWVPVQLGSGTNLSVVKADTYDIYFDLASVKIYVMKAGSDYTSAVEQTVSGEEPEQEEPEVTANMLYLKPNSNWMADNARFAAYFFGGTPGEKWVSMTDSDADGIYEVNIPEGYDYGCNVIFCRMNPNTTANNWNNKWNQTSDLTAPTDGKNLYTVKDGTWDNGGGTWSTRPTFPITIAEGDQNKQTLALYNYLLEKYDLQHHVETDISEEIYVHLYDNRYKLNSACLCTSGHGKSVKVDPESIIFTVGGSGLGINKEGLVQYWSDER